MKTVVGISLGADDQDFAFDARLLRQPLNVRRLGTNGSTAKALKLLKHWGQIADAIGIGVVKDSYTVGSTRFIEKDSVRLKNAVTRVPVTTGGRLSDILQEWALRHVQGKLGGYFNNARVLFFSGRTNYKLAQAMSEYTGNLEFADPLLQLGVPKLLGSLDTLELYTSGAHYVLDWTPDALMASAPVKEWTNFVLRRALRDATVVVAPVHELDDFGAEELAGKTIITSTVNDRRIAQFKDKGVHMVIDGSPMLFGHVLGPEPPRRDDPRRHREGARRAAGGRLPRDHHRPAARAAHHLPQRLQAREPVRVRHSPAVAGVLQEHQADRASVARVAAGVHGHGGKGDGVRAAVRLLEGDRHQVADGRGDRRLAHLRWRHAEGDHEPQPRVHVSPAAGRRADGQAPRCADHGPGRVHEGRRRRRPHGRAARAAADHHRQQLQRLRARCGPRTTPCCGWDS